MAIPEGESANDLALRLEARVTDATEREVTGRTGLIGTAGPWVVAIGTNKYVHAPGSTAAVRVRVVDYLGRPQAKVPVKIVLGQPVEKYGSWDGPLTTLASATVTTGADGFASWDVPLPNQSGSYVLRAEATSGERVMRSSRSLWVPGGNVGAYDQEDRSVEIVADKGTYQPGETARFLVRGLDAAATLLITKEHATTTWHTVQGVTAGGTFDVPVTDDDVGDTWVNIVFVQGRRPLHGRAPGEGPAGESPVAGLGGPGADRVAAARARRLHGEDARRDRHAGAPRR